MKNRFGLTQPLRSLLAGLGVLLVGAPAAMAGDQVVLLTSWYAQAEQGGFYQALAEGLYEKEGLEVTIRMGGPQVNGMQLLVSRQADFIVNYDLQILKSVEQGLPVVAVAAPFQGDPQGLMTHADVSGLDGLNNKQVLVSTSGQQTWWPWLKGKYQLQDSQARPYTFNLQPFLAGADTTQQAYASSELFQAIKAGQQPNFFLFADAGYPPYGSTVATRQDLIDQHPQRVAAFVRASLEGWKRYLDNPAAGNALIKRDNPNMSDELLAWGVSTLKQHQLLTRGDAALHGIGTMSDARWQATRDFMVEAGLLGAGAPWQKAYTTRFVQDLHVLPGTNQAASR
ncbi:ABC transporter substrate-binding protein [Pseudomonas vlassakiae]|jgi:NitT/TauT family transport system substrate-binding protein|uniref:ABC transporter substrate-binding protein n=1 Tax=Pseudomonas TaxID=286 RepID=UPI0006D472E6|nr:MULTISPECIES: ABC transporter substrate-binding protein [Pseudomonas]AXQ48139.1 ABC transporter substrate-binding protein [Stenotrophomonas rhizophila]MCU0124986.1 ABC transporter substrate-binding protein [Pseudomonas vlassakiae]HCV40398.1 ABC transporter substrate-binding protein [Pseudomonas sp.]